MGKPKTNDKGESTFSLKGVNSIITDTSNTYNILISFGGDESFKKAKKSISFKDADIEAKIITKDSVNYVTGILTGSQLI